MIEVGWPHGQGELIKTAHADPGAGNSFQFVIPAGEIWWFLTFWVHIQTDANPANRNPVLYMSASSMLEYWHIAFPTAITAGAFGEVSLGYGGAVPHCNTIMSGATPMLMWGGYLPKLYLVAGEYLMFNMTNKQAGDVMQNIKTAALVWKA